MKNLKNFCAAISTDFAKELDELAAKFNLKTKTQLLEFLAANVAIDAPETLRALAAEFNLKTQMQLLEFLAANVAIDAPKTLRAQNIPYQLECYITAALRGTAAITKQAANTFVSGATGCGRINTKTIDSVLCLYLSEIKEHAAAHGYGQNSDGDTYKRHADFIEGLEAAAAANA